MYCFNHLSSQIHVDLLFCILIAALCRLISWARFGRLWLSSLIAVLFSISCVSWTHFQSRHCLFLACNSSLSCLADCFHPVTRACSGCLGSWHYPEWFLPLAAPFDGLVWLECSLCDWRLDRRVLLFLSQYLDEIIGCAGDGRRGEGLWRSLPLFFSFAGWLRSGWYNDKQGKCVSYDSFYLLLVFCIWLVM